MPIELPLYQVDAFADRVFAGNPAAVILLHQWLPDPVMGEIAAENNLAETAFLVPDGDGFALRWFTPTVEVPLCGHATLAAGAVILDHVQPGRKHVSFSTRRSGPLTVTRTDTGFCLDLPAHRTDPVATPPALADALGMAPRLTLTQGNLIAVFESAAQIAEIRPDFAKIMTLDTKGVIITAPGPAGVDFVSRYFTPQQGINEDPVTGSAHCALVPYWAKRLAKTRLVAHQLSARGGVLQCEDKGARIALSGQAQLYLEGRIFLPSR